MTAGWLQRLPVQPLAYASLAASMLLVGTYVGLSRLLVATLPVLLLAWLRFALAGVAMLHWFAPRGGDAALTRRDHGLLFVQSLLGNFLFSICMLYGVKLTSALAAGVTMAALPAAVALLSRLLLNERIGLRTAAGIACAAAAIALLALVRTGADGGQAGAGAGDDQMVLIGYALLVVAVFCEASYVVIGKRLTARVSPRRISAMINLWGLVLVTPLGLVAAWQFEFGAVPISIWWLLVFYALAASVWSVWLWMFGLRHVPAPKAGIFTVMLPIGAATVGVLWLGEPFGWGHASAFGLALAGLVLAVWAPSTAAPVGARAPSPPRSGSVRR